MKYVWVRTLPQNHYSSPVEKKVELVNNLGEIFKRADYDPDKDKFYQLGNEVEVKLDIKVKSNDRGRDGRDNWR